MTLHPPFCPRSRFAFCSALIAVSAVMPSVTWAQTTSPGNDLPSRGETAPAAVNQAPAPAAAAARTNAAKAAQDVQGTEAIRALKSGEALSVRDGLVTQVGSGRPVSEGSRVLRLPGKCTPKTSSLDCVNQAGQANTGADVSSRVRNGVVNEVGAARGATEGSGTVKRKETCTPQAGKLTCD